ncbi:hypothetical protein L9F63_011374, partial [Diploptera punctata]
NVMTFCLPTSCWSHIRMCNLERWTTVQPVRSDMDSALSARNMSRNLFLDSDSDDEVLYDMFLKTRKLRQIRGRPDHIENYNDEEFFVRFRLDLIRHRLEHKTK